MFAKKTSNQSLAHRYCYSATSHRPSIADLGSNIGADLFRTHLFPSLSRDVREDDNRVLVPRTPLLNSSTRHTISDTILYLVRDDETQYETILDLLSDLVPYDSRISDGRISFPLYQTLLIDYRALYL